MRNPVPVVRGRVFGGVKVAIRPLTEPDLEAVVAFSLDAWAPVLAGVMGSRIFGCD